MRARARATRADLYYSNVAQIISFCCYSLLDIRSVQIVIALGYGQRAGLIRRASAVFVRLFNETDASNKMYVARDRAVLREEAGAYGLKSTSRGECT